MATTLGRTNRLGTHQPFARVPTSRPVRSKVVKVVAQNTLAEGSILKGSEKYEHLSPVRKKLFAEDPGLNQSLLPWGTLSSEPFNQDKWAEYRRTDRYLYYLLKTTQSTVFKRVFQPALQVTFLATCICLFNHFQPLGWAATLNQLPHVLAGSAISLLLVFKTNSAYNRFNDARNLWGRMINNSRDFIRMASLHLSRELAYKMALYIQCYAITMKSHLRLGRTNLPPGDLTAYRDDPTEAVNALLGKEEAAEVLGVFHRPYISMCKMTETIKKGVEQAKLSISVCKQMGDYVTEYGAITGASERLLSTPIPLSYTRHTSRCMLLWLLTLPFALWSTMSFATIPAIFILSYVFMGIDEIGMVIEEPFAVLPLLPICRIITRDVEIAMSHAGRVRNWSSSMNAEGHSDLALVLPPISTESPAPQTAAKANGATAAPSTTEEPRMMLWVGDLKSVKVGA